ncbi:MAG: HAMP domain-containing histidine kinase [Anaerolineales bacterium]|nr:HAMP domain-containing histidine kinase [Anaerolineales bacterium]
MRLRIGLALLPLALGLAAMILLQKLMRPLPLLSIKIDFGLLAFFAGIFLSTLLLLVVPTRYAYKRQREYGIAREKLKHAEAQRRFLRRLDHELKNPLTGIRAALANLEGTGGAGATPSAIPDIQHQVERLTRLTAGLRKLADLEEIPLEYTKVNLGELLKETVEAVRALPSVSGRDLRLIVPSVPWPLPEITGDRDLLSLAFFNLIENAMKYTGRVDTVEVRASEQARHVQVEIADTGPGIPPEELPRLFEELYRGTNARGCEGSGLGLALVRRVVNRHEGTVTVRSRRDGGRGTVFAVTLPVAAHIPQKSKSAG